MRKVIHLDLGDIAKVRITLEGDRVVAAESGPTDSKDWYPVEWYEDMRLVEA